ncbi:DUF559 domain-containing protein [Pseudonocardia sp.]|uniref:DUF559 domain-containing protein n=1 Tax=Pseudonocardia sp. TaxID=60912 RepID=UPI003451CFFA
MGLEYDGDAHTGRRAQRRDRRRMNFLEDAGWTVFHATDLDVLANPAPLMAKVAAALDRGSRAAGLPKLSIMGSGSYFPAPRRPSPMIGAPHGRSARDPAQVRSRTCSPGPGP